MPDVRSVSVRMTDELLARIDAAVDRMNELDLGVTTSRSGWCVAAIEAQLDLDEQAAVHVPDQVTAALPRRRGNRMIMPAGRVMPR